MGRKLELKAALCDRVDESDFSVAAYEQFQAEGSRRAQLSALANKTSSLILRLSSRVCQVDLFDKRHSERGPLERRPVGAQHADGLQPDLEREEAGGRPDGAGWFWAHWPKLLYVITLFSMAKITLNICFQYQYDRNLLRLQWARENEIPLDTKKLELEARASRQRLKSIGAPHLNCTIAIECAYSTIILLCLLAYVLAYLYFRYVEKYDFYLLRCILERRHEQGRCNEMILAEIKKFVESRRNYTNNCLQNCPVMRRACPHRPEEAAAARKLVQRLALDHQLVIKQFKLMASSGALVPPNRTDGWIDLMSLIFCLMNCSFYAWSLFFNFLFYTFLPRIARFEVESEPLDLAFNVDLAITATMITFGLTFYLSTSIVSCVDQARLIAKVRRLVLDCIRINTQIYLATGPQRAAAGLGRSWKWPSKGEGAELLADSTSSLDLSGHYRCAQLNANLLHAIMHYKIFVVQLQPVLKPVAFVSMVSICTMLLHPALIRLHTPYVRNLTLRSRYYFISLIAAFFVNCNILPVCYINSRCVDLYNALFSLLAHTIELSLHHEDRKSAAAPRPDRGPLAEEKPSASIREDIYDSHSIWSLRRELEASQRFVRQFETRTMGLTFTYSNLLRIYFWLSAILLSIWMEPSELEGANSPAGSAFNAFLKDPLGFYKF